MLLLSMQSGGSKRLRNKDGLQPGAVLSSPGEHRRALAKQQQQVRFSTIVDCLRLSSS